MGTFVTNPSETLFDDKETAPGAELPAGWTENNVPTAGNLNDLRDACYDLRDAITDTPTFTALGACNAQWVKASGDGAPRYYMDGVHMVLTGTLIVSAANPAQYKGTLFPATTIANPPVAGTMSGISDGVGVPFPVTFYDDNEPCMGAGRIILASDGSILVERLAIGNGFNSGCYVSLNGIRFIPGV